MNLGQLRTHVRDIINEDSAVRYSDAMLNRVINRVAKMAYSKIVEQNELHFATLAQITQVSGTQEYTLPSSGGTMKVLLVERTDQGVRRQLGNIPLVLRASYMEGSILAQQFTDRWYLSGTKIGFAPIPTTSPSTPNIDIIHIPPLADLGTDAAELPLDWPDPHHNVIIFQSAMWALTRDKALAAIYAPLAQQSWDLMVEDMSSRQSQEPKRIIPVDDDYD